MRTRMGRVSPPEEKWDFKRCHVAYARSSEEQPEKDQRFRTVFASLRSLVGCRCSWHVAGITAVKRSSKPTGGGVHQIGWYQPSRKIVSSWEVRTALGGDEE